MNKFIAWLEAIARWMGALCAALALILVITSTLVVVLRYGFAIGSTELQELLTYLHATLFMLAIGFTLQRDHHVRVDVVYRRLDERGKAWVNCVGYLLFLLPFSAFILVTSWDFAMASWAIREGSPNAYGIDGVFWLKSLIPLMAISLFLQGSANFLKHSQLLIGGYTHG